MSRPVVLHRAHPMPPRDLAQPFVLPDVHPASCDCVFCAEDPAGTAPSLARELATTIVVTLGGFVAGQVIARILDAAGVLALLGIG